MRGGTVAVTVYNRLGHVASRFWASYCEGCNERFQGPKALAQIRCWFHRQHCQAVALGLVAFIQRREVDARHTGEPFEDYLAWIWPSAFTRKQKRYARIYCEHKGYDWSVFGDYAP